MVSLALLPLVTRQLSGLVADLPRQSPLGCLASSPRPNSGWSRKVSVIEFAHGPANAGLMAPDLVSRFSDTERNEAIVRAVIAVDQFEQQASGNVAQAVKAGAALNVVRKLNEVRAVMVATKTAQLALFGAVPRHWPPPSPSTWRT
jgi:hypothetical protein